MSCIHDEYTASTSLPLVRFASHRPLAFHAAWSTYYMTIAFARVWQQRYRCNMIKKMEANPTRHRQGACDYCGWNECIASHSTHMLAKLDSNFFFLFSTFDIILLASASIHRKHLFRCNRISSISLKLFRLIWMPYHTHNRLQILWTVSSSTVSKVLHSKVIKCKKVQSPA